MAPARMNSLQQFASYVVRPALLEARPLSDKHAMDAVYMVTLAEELLRIEARMAAMEQAAQQGASAAAVKSGTSHSSEDWSDANWIRAKSRELEHRLRRLEQLPVQG
jgi:outer membrane PBP1 activator LpoA protein